MAAQARDAPAVKETGSAVLTLAKGMGEGAPITPNAKPITKGANNPKWKTCALNSTALRTVCNRR